MLISFLIQSMNRGVAIRKGSLRLALVSLVTAASITIEDAAANIYAFKDEKGVTHFSNLPHLDKRFKLVYKIPTASNLRPNAWSASGPRVVDIEKLVPIIAEAARAHGLDAKLIHAVIRAESGYNENAVSSKGAVGLMQLIPATAQRYGVVNSYDPTQNIAGGTRYLRDLLKMFNGNIELALAGYNAGENAVIRAGHRIPPYPETMAYVPKVLSFYRSPEVSRF